MMLAIRMAMLFLFSPCFSEKWCEMFAQFTKQDINAENLKCLVSFCLALPGCNAAVEREQT
jgi:hypothetical protein